MQISLDPFQGRVLILTVFVMILAVCPAILAYWFLLLVFCFGIIGICFLFNTIGANDTELQ